MATTDPCSGANCLLSVTIMNPYITYIKTLGPHSLHLRQFIPFFKEANTPTVDNDTLLNLNRSNMNT